MGLRIQFHIIVFLEPPFGTGKNNPAFLLCGNYNKRVAAKTTIKNYIYETVNYHYPTYYANGYD